MATNAEFFVRKLTIELDILANQYNKTKDPGIRDKWYKKLEKLRQVLQEEHFLEYKKT